MARAAHPANVAQAHAEQRQRERMAQRFAGRTSSAATADFDLPAPNDVIDVAQVGELSDAGIPASDQVVETNVALMRQRSAVGVEKYGTTLADSGLPVRALLVHALEESLDMANYIQAVIQQSDALAAAKKG